MKCPTCGLDADTNLCPDPIHEYPCHRCKITTEVTTVGSEDLCHACLLSHVAALRAELAEAQALLVPLEDNLRSLHQETEEYVRRTDAELAEAVALLRECHTGEKDMAVTAFLAKLEAKR